VGHPAAVAEEIPALFADEARAALAATSFDLRMHTGRSKHRPYESTPTLMGQQHKEAAL